MLISVFLIDGRKAWIEPERVHHILEDEHGGVPISYLYLRDEEAAMQVVDVDRNIAMRINGKSDSHAKVYADWLEERGELKAAELLRRFDENP